MVRFRGASPSGQTLSPRSAWPCQLQGGDHRDPGSCMQARAGRAAPLRAREAEAPRVSCIPSCPASHMLQEVRVGLRARAGGSGARVGPGGRLLHAPCGSRAARPGLARRRARARPVRARAAGRQPRARRGRARGPRPPARHRRRPGARTVRPLQHLTLPYHL